MALTTYLTSKATDLVNPELEVKKLSLLHERLSEFEDNIASQQFAREDLDF